MNNLCRVRPCSLCWPYLNIIIVFLLNFRFLPFRLNWFWWPRSTLRFCGWLEFWAKLYVHLTSLIWNNMIWFQAEIKNPVNFLWKRTIIFLSTAVTNLILSNCLVGSYWQFVVKSLLLVICFSIKIKCFDSFTSILNMYIWCDTFTENEIRV